jgi:hypothetical protein
MMVAQSSRSLGAAAAAALWRSATKDKEYTMLRVNYCLVPFMVVFWVCATRQARADLILDQSHVVPTFQGDFAVITVQSVAQTFTVGVAGELAQVDLQIYKNTGTIGDLVFSIRTTIGGVPNPDDSQSLFQTIIPLSAIPTIDNPFLPVPLTSIDVSSAGIAVTPGDVLALSLSRMGVGSPPWVLWRQSLDGTYPGGSTFTRASPLAPWTPAFGGNADGGFQTFVSVGGVVPEPSSLILCLLGGILVWFRVWHGRARANTH